jgi:arginine decarboxylase
MQEVAMNDRDASKMLRTYNVAYWGNNYYDVNELGHISVCPDPDVPQARVDLAELVKQRQNERFTSTGVVLLPADPAAPSAFDQRRV